MSSLAKAMSVALLLGTAGQAAADNSTAISIALLQIRQNPTTTRLSAYDAFIARGVTVDRNGTEHVRFDRTYKRPARHRRRPGRALARRRVQERQPDPGRAASAWRPRRRSPPARPSRTPACSSARLRQHPRPPARRLRAHGHAARWPTTCSTPAPRRTARRSACTTTSTPPTARSSTSSNAIETGTLPGTGAATGTYPPRAECHAADRHWPFAVGRRRAAEHPWNATRRVYEMKDLTRGNTHINDIGNGSAVTARWSSTATTSGATAPRQRPRVRGSGCRLWLRQDLGLLQEQLQPPRHRRRRQGRVRHRALPEQLQQCLLEQRLLLHGVRRRRRRATSSRWWRST